MTACAIVKQHSPKESGHCTHRAMRVPVPLLSPPLAHDLDWRMVIEGTATQINRRTAASSENKAFRWPNAADNHVCPYELTGFLQRIHRYSLASVHSFVLALNYIDTVVEMTQLSSLPLRVTASNAHMLALTAVAVATKFIDDKSVSNKRYAEISGQPTAVLNGFESTFLMMLRFSLHRTPAEYAQYEAQITKSWAGGQGSDAMLHLAMICGTSSSASEAVRCTVAPVSPFSRAPRAPPHKRAAARGGLLAATSTADVAARAFG